MQPTRQYCGGQHTALFGLAPRGVYRALAVTSAGGGLLPHLFTLTPVKERFVFCGTVHLPQAEFPGFPGARCPQVFGLSSPLRS